MTDTGLVDGATANGTRQENPSAADDCAADPGEAAAEASPAHPPGEYAIVEILGHQTIVGRVEEVQRFGTAMLKIEPIFAGRLLDAVYQGGASIYRFSPCSPAQAFERAPTHSYQLPAAVRALMPPEALPAPSAGLSEDYGEEDDACFDDHDEDYDDEEPF